MPKAKDSEGCAAPLRLLERSVFSDRMVFVRAVHEARWLSEMELSIYDSWYRCSSISRPHSFMIEDMIVYDKLNHFSKFRLLTDSFVTSSFAEQEKGSRIMAPVMGSADEAQKRVQV